MPSTQELLQSIIDMQSNAQRSLPVIPNNGNPMGANNMPRNTGIVPPHMQQPQGGGYDSSGINPQANRRLPMDQMAERYPWLKPSQSMDNIRSYLNSRRVSQRQYAQPQLPVFHSPQVLGGREVVSDPVTLPIMPMRGQVM